MPSTDNTVAYADISQYLAADKVSKGGLFSTNTSPQLSTVLMVENFFLDYLNINDADNEFLPGFTNYVWGLCGAFGLTAQGIISGGGGSITPVVPAILPPPYQFRVSASSFIVTGQSLKSIPAFAGRNLLFVRNNITQSTVNTGGTYYSWDATTYTFQCFGAAAEDELLQLFAV